MKPHLLKAAISNFNESYSELKILFEDSESYLKTLKIPDGPWKDSAHWKYSCLLEDLLGAKMTLTKIYKILPPETHIKEPDVKETLFNSIVAEQNLKILQLNDRIASLEGNIEERHPKTEVQAASKRKKPLPPPKKSKKS